MTVVSPLKFVVPFVLVLATAQAELIHDNGPPAPAEDGWEMTNWVEADDFTLEAGSRILAIKFWDFEIPGSFGGSVSWRIYSNASSNSPGARIASGTSSNLTHAATGAVAFGPYREFVTTLQIVPVDLQRGIYWLALQIPAPANNPSRVFYWESTLRAGRFASHNRPVLADGTEGLWRTNEFPSYPSELAFQIEGIRAPRVTSFTVGNGIPKLRFTTTANQNYRVEFKNNLLEPAWSPLPGWENVAGNGQEIVVEDSDPGLRTQSKRFYRAVLL